jgi:hypothetical protein
LLRCRCACGGSLGLAGACEECREKRYGSPQQTAATGAPAPAGDETSRAPGEPLDRPARASNERRLGHDFRHVPLHAPRARRLDVAETTEAPGPSDAQPADDPFCLHTRPGQGAERCEFTGKQARVVSAMRYAARGVTSQALVNLSRGDPYMTTLAGRILHVPDPDMGQIATTVSQILDNLRSKPVVCGTCADEDCYTAGVVAHVTEDLSTVVLCQRFFLTGVTQMRRTWIHEAGHAAGVDSSLGNVPERYCSEGPEGEGCADPCSNLTGDLSQNVDAWAHFIECAAFAG